MGRGVMLLPSGSSVTAMKLESEIVGIALTCHLERNKRKFGNDDRQEWSLISGKIHRESMTRRCKALLIEIVIAAMLCLVMLAVSWWCRTPKMRLSDKDFQFVKDDIKWVKYSLVFVTIQECILIY